ncbi:hypothetical protein M422DRAFT_269437 [Sphaerobolus stellatus SS14]|uniref:Uncharacterized protein n=1 Tax=Sphaerobolus stellatus (strain SS14) TaxID=990650 RepID=A0A0C9UV26_SPHS4|nr:hypothetical protein M422DRAFT_269437 [Sphaerobolus stellatus SS14]
MAFVDTMHMDVFRGSVTHAAKRKAKFDAKMTEVIFKKGDLIQLYSNKMDGNHETRNKLLRCWSTPMRIRERFNTSYTVETLEGLVLQGLTHAWCLRCFIPRRNTELAALEREARAVEERGEATQEERGALVEEITAEDIDDEHTDDERETDEENEPYDKLTAGTEEPGEESAEDMGAALEVNAGTMGTECAGMHVYSGGGGHLRQGRPTPPEGRARREGEVQESAERT